MAEDFFAELGETITKTAKGITSKADGFFESQKIRTKILSEQRMIDKTLTDIGNVIYKKYVDGNAVDEDIVALCEDVTQRKVEIAKYREEVAKMKGQKVCAACGVTVPADADFCMKCGAPCPKEEEPEGESFRDVTEEDQEPNVEEAQADTDDVSQSDDQEDKQE